MHSESKSAQSEKSNSDVLRELREMFKDGKRLLELNQAMQREETARIEISKRELARQKADVEREAKLLMLLMTDLDEDIPYKVESGPMWSHGNATCTLAVRGYKADSSRASSTSRPGSRSQSSTRKPSASPARGATSLQSSLISTPNKKPRPRSAYISPQGRVPSSGGQSLNFSTMTTSGAKRIIKSRAGSMSPSKDP